jgi:hypothetical protein
LVDELEELSQVFNDKKKVYQSIDQKPVRHTDKLQVKLISQPLKIITKLSRSNYNKPKLEMFRTIDAVHQKNRKYF